jgi:hypothetical protein
MSMGYQDTGKSQKVESAAEKQEEIPRKSLEHLLTPK